MKNLWILCSILVAAIVCNPAWAFSKQPTKPETDTQAGKDQAVSWHDGTREQTAYIAANEVAVFKADDSVVKSLDSEAEQVEVMGTTKIYRLQAMSGTDAARNLRGSAQASPVFRATPSGGPARALPGGVILALDEAMSETEAAQWLADQGINNAERFDFGTNLFLVPTEAGMASLEEANRLHELEGVRYASPNWWTEKATR